MSRRIIVETDAEPADPTSPVCDRVRCYLDGEEIVALECPVGHRWGGRLSEAERDEVIDMARDWFASRGQGEWPAEWYPGEVGTLMAPVGREVAA